METGDDDILEKFLNWFLKEGPPIGLVPLFDAVHKIEDVTSVTWFRLPPFQVQLFIVPPNYVIPEHTHPNVDSFEVYVGGQITFTHSGQVKTHPVLNDIQGEYGTSYNRGTTIRVRPNDKHGGTFGPAGGVFMSVQHWLNGVMPHCVAADYDGVVMGPDHLSKVKFGKPVLKDNLTAADAGIPKDLL